MVEATSVLPPADDDGGTDPCWWSARHVAAAIATRQISAREYLAALQARIEDRNTVLNAVVTLDERAAEWAWQADEAVASGRALGPLHGVAMTVKDCFATRGLRTTAGMSLLKSYVPREDAATVARLREAGAIVFGKTNLPEGSGDLQAFNDLFGLARNPWHPDYSPGGSSGGAASAVAAGLSPLEIGSDIAGSIRIPAANCGVFGHKPSFGIVPAHGHVPPAPFQLHDVDISVIGPIARCVEDLETMLAILAGPNQWDQPAWRLELPPARPVRRIATWFDDPYCPVDDEVRAALEDAAGRLAEAGIEVCPARPPGIRLDVSDALYRRLLASAAVNSYSKEAVEAIAMGETPAGPELGAEFVAQRYRDWAEADAKRMRLRERWRHFFDDFDAILLPVAPGLAIEHDLRPLAERDITVNGVRRQYWDQIVWAGLTGVCYLPSTVVPLRTDSRGVPIGMAVTAGYLQDCTALAVARLVAGTLPPIGHPHPGADAAPLLSSHGHRGDA
jgi:amidase